MSRMLQRPPARFVVHDRPEGLFGRVTGKTAGGMMNAAKSYATSNAGNLDLRDGGSNIALPATMPSFGTRLARTFLIVWQDLLQINPAHSQPNLIYYSGAQPFIRTGHMRRWTRTFMSAGPRFQGRVAYVGVLERVYTERTRITGVPTRQGTSYRYPRYKVSPRAIQLGQGGPD
jgi:hypothetical protein